LRKARPRDVIPDSTWSMVKDGNQAKSQGLLQLAERGQDREPEDIQFGEEANGNQDDNSLITQVTTRDEVKRPAVVPSERAAKQNGWKHRLQNLFCCFAPQTNDQYYRPEPDSVVLKPPQPPAPPRHIGHAVLGPINEKDIGKKTLVLDLDETLVHSSFKPILDPDFIIPVEIEGRIVDVYVLKRPLMDEFLAAVGESFEVVVFTASLSKYADPLLDLLDPYNVIRWRLFRESCYPYEGNYVKNLLCLGRDLADVIIVDNSPHSYVFQPDNALPVGTFIDDPEDVELPQILKVLRGLENVRDVRQHLGRLVNSILANGHV